MVVLSVVIYYSIYQMECGTSVCQLTSTATDWIAVVDYEIFDEIKDEDCVDEEESEEVTDDNLEEGYEEIAKNEVDHLISYYGSNLIVETVDVDEEKQDEVKMTMIILQMRTLLLIILQQDDA